MVNGTTSGVAAHHDVGVAAALLEVRIEERLAGHDGLARCLVAGRRHPLGLLGQRHLAVGALLRQALGRHANADSPASGSGPTISAAGWHTLLRVWDGQQVGQYLDGLRTNSTATTAIGNWTIYRCGWQFTDGEGLDEAYVPFFGAFGAAWDDAMVACWSASPLGMLWPERDAPFLGSERVVQVRRQDRSGRWSSSLRAS